ncbi:GYF domain-containing protein [Bradyrhizobium sp. 2TAF24]|uniref:GYF domain-containing protein n=1 Tax=Bradyrhizobium sp. 2TAF24 TaxID=3233011 RepID=UPI003F922B05
MSVEWFLHDGEDQVGPLSEAELRRRIAGHERADRLRVWRDGFAGWKTAAEALKPDDRATRPRRAKFRWALYGALPGALLAAADILLQWRGPVLLPWGGMGTAHNIGYLAGTIVPLMVVGFIAGAIRDWRAAAARREPGAEGSVSEAVSPAPPESLRFNNFIARNWRGDFSLPVSYWVFGILGNIAILLVPYGLSLTPGVKSGFHPLALFVAFVGMWLAIAVISLWQWVSVWRSAGRYIADRRAAGRAAPWGYIARVMVFVALLQSIGAALDQGVPQVREVTRIAFLDDPDIPDYSIRVMRNGTEAEISGGIKYGLTDDFATVLRASRQIRVVHLDSIGGRLGEGEKLYQLIKDNGLITYVSGQCLSACTVAFAGGRERVLLHRATLGFHRGSFAGKDEKDTPELQGQRRVFSEAGYSPQFITRALATENADIWKPSEAELIQAHVITRVSDGADFAISGFSFELTRANLADWIVQTSNWMGAVRTRDPRRFEDIVGVLYDGVVAGKTETEVAASLGGRIREAVIAIELRADDDVLVDFANLHADRIDALAAESAARCFDYASTETMTGSIAALTPELKPRTNQIKERIIQTSAERPEASQLADKALWAKLIKRLMAKGMTREDFDLVDRSDVADKDKATYCRVRALLYREAAALPRKEAAMLIRGIISGK